MRKQLKNTVCYLEANENLGLKLPAKKQLNRYPLVRHHRRSQLLWAVKVFSALAKNLI